MKKQNITLVGMSGVGKSTIGKKLAKDIGWNFVDTDRLMEKDFGKSVQKIVKELGDQVFMDTEAKKINEFLKSKNTIFAPGGSIIYSEKVMDSLSKISKIIYLERDLDFLLKNIDLKKRGIIGIKNKTYQEIFSERKILYEKWSDVTINLNEKSEAQARDFLKEIINHDSV